MPSGDKIVSALPDFSGRLWFVSANGVVGTLDFASGAVRSLDLGEEVSNSFAVDETGGVYIVSKKALYRFDTGPGGAPAQTWREVYRNSGIAKPGQVHDGSGTTPTLMAGGRVAIADNADPMNVVVYRRGTGVSGQRLICEEPVFRKGASATDNSLIAARNSLVVENNYGYSGPTATMNGQSTGARPRARGRARRWSRLPHRLAFERDGADRGAQALAGDGAGLHLHQAGAPGQDRRVVPHGAELVHRQARVPAPHRDRPRLQQQLRAGVARP